MVDLKQLTESVESGIGDRATALVQEAIDTGSPPKEVLDSMVRAMDEVGRKFQACEVFMPQMLLASRAMKAGVELLEPSLVQDGITPEATAVIGTVEGDLHDIGKNLVVMMWKGANFDVIDLGMNVAPEKFIEAIQRHEAQLVGLSALLTTTMPAMKKTVEAVKAAGVEQTKIIIGGAPVTDAFARDIGAHAYASDAAQAVDVVRGLLAT